ncbi:MAG: hypothetical protein L0177_13260 [Chloroflexi bacterium]|nr:hypothetical protein [Chloroflexota bacterium]
MKSQYKVLMAEMLVFVALLLAACTAEEQEANAPAAQRGPSTTPSATIPAASPFASPEQASAQASPTSTPARGYTPTPTSSHTPLPTSAPVAAPSFDEPGAVALFLALYLDSDSDLLKTIVTDFQGNMLGTEFIELDSDSMGLVMFLPETRESVLLESYSSPSYARHTKRPLTVNDQLFVTVKWSGSESLDVNEHDPATFETLARHSTSDNAITDTLAIVGAQAYYRTEVESTTRYDNVFRRVVSVEVGGELARLSLSGGSGRETLGKLPPWARLVSLGGELHAATIPTADEPNIYLFRFDESSWEPGPVLTSFAPENLDQFVSGSWMNAVSDNDTAYWAAGQSIEGEHYITLWAYDLAAAPELPQLAGLIEIPTSFGALTNITDFDVDDGVVAIWPSLSDGSASTIILLDLATGESEFVDAGFEFFDVQLMRLGE